MCLPSSMSIVMSSTAASLVASSADACALWRLAAGACRAGRSSADQVKKLPLMATVVAQTCSIKACRGLMALQCTGPAQQNAQAAECAGSQQAVQAKLVFPGMHRQLSKCASTSGVPSTD